MATATYIPIATQTLGSAASSITFSSIPNTYTDLRLVLTGLATTNGDFPNLQFNGDTSTNYSYTYLLGNGTSASSASPTSQTSLGLDASGISSTLPPMLSADIFSYAGSTNKTCLVQTAEDKNGSGSAYLNVGLWRSTAAITSIKLNIGNTFQSGTTATLWGI